MRPYVFFTHIPAPILQRFAGLSTIKYPVENIALLTLIPPMHNRGDRCQVSRRPATIGETHGEKFL